jgi:hypothetical protein
MFTQGGRPEPDVTRPDTGILYRYQAGVFFSTNGNFLEKAQFEL